ncbi:uncharacterized protein [Hemitrygon akajei]|uniref:uncharacterized protein n=1 Tax=Hemitrygon akajei TaxID=2704970 RepID=UPI003BF9F9D8
MLQTGMGSKISAFANRVMCSKPKGKDHKDLWAHIRISFDSHEKMISCRDNDLRHALRQSYEIPGLQRRAKLSGYGMLENTVEEMCRNPWISVVAVVDPFIAGTIAGRFMYKYWHMHWYKCYPNGYELAEGANERNKFGEQHAIPDLWAHIRISFDSHEKMISCRDTDLRHALLQNHEIPGLQRRAKLLGYEKTAEEMCRNTWISVVAVVDPFIAGTIAGCFMYKYWNMYWNKCYPNGYELAEETNVRNNFGEQHAFPDLWAHIRISFDSHEKMISCRDTDLRPARLQNHEIPGLQRRDKLLGYGMLEKTAEELCRNTWISVAVVNPFIAGTIAGFFMYKYWHMYWYKCYPNGYELAEGANERNKFGEQHAIPGSAENMAEVAINITPPGEDFRPPVPPDKSRGKVTTKKSKDGSGENIAEVSRTITPPEEDVRPPVPPNKSIVKVTTKKSKNDVKLRHKRNLGNQSRMLNLPKPRLISDIYTEPTITVIQGEHGDLTGKSNMHMPEVEHHELFKQSNSDYHMSKISVVYGAAGTGKTTLIQKLIYDWATGKKYEEFSFVLHFNMQKLNAIKGRITLSRLILDAYPYLENYLDHLWNEPKRLLFIFDDLDQLHQPLTLSDTGRNSDPRYRCTDTESEYFVSDILRSLLQGEFLRGCSVLITTRVWNLEALRHVTVDSTFQVMGFNAKKIKEYFRRYLCHGQSAKEIVEFIEQNDILWNICSDPLFCFTLASSLESFQAQGKGQTTNRIGIHTQVLFNYVAHLIAKCGYDGDTNRKCLTVVGELADKGIRQNMLSFEGNAFRDLDSCTLMFISAFMYQDPDKQRGGVIYEFRHSVLRDFLAALTNVLNAPISRLKRILDEIFTDITGRFGIFSIFLVGLCSRKSTDRLERDLQKVPTQVTSCISEWLRKSVSRRLKDMDTKHTQRMFLCILYSLLEFGDNEIMKEVLDSIPTITLNHLRLKPLDCIVLSRTLISLEVIQELDLSSCFAQPEEICKLEEVMCRCVILRLNQNNLQDSGVKSLFDVLKNSKVKMLALKSNHLTDNCLESAFFALTTNPSLIQLNMSNSSQDEKQANQFTDEKLQYHYERFNQQKKITHIFHISVLWKIFAASPKIESNGQTHFMAKRQIVRRIPDVKLRHKRNLGNQSRMLNLPKPRLISDIYTEPTITVIQGEHGDLTGKSNMHMPEVEHHELFKQSNSDYHMSKISVVYGAAGTGKTTLIQKLIYDWATGKKYEEFSFVLHFNMQKLNAIKGRITLSRLILDAYPYLENYLDHLWNEPKRLLFIFDDLDQLHQPLTLSDTGRNSDPRYRCTDTESEYFVSDILRSLLQGEFLRGCSVLITTRVWNLEALRHVTVDSTFQVMGFNAKKIKEYFRRYLCHGQSAKEIVEFIEQNDILWNICSDPLFCFTLASSLESFQAQGKGQTTNRIGIHTQVLFNYVAHLIAKCGYDGDTNRKCLTVVGELADKGIRQNMLSFEGNAFRDLDSCTLMFISAFMYQDPDKQRGGVIYEFRHSVLRDFLAALTNVLNAPISRLKRILDEIFTDITGRFGIFSIFLVGLCSRKSTDRLERDLQKVPTQVTSCISEWLRKSVSRRLKDMDTKHTQRMFLCILYSLLEFGDNEIMKEVLDSIPTITLNHLRLKPLDCIVLSRTLISLEVIQELDLSSCFAQPEEICKLEEVMCRCVILRLNQNNLQDSGVKSLFDVLKNSKVKMLALKSNHLTDNCLESAFFALTTNPSLIQLNMSNSSQDEKQANQFTDEKLQYHYERFNQQKKITWQRIKHIVQSVTESNCLTLITE